MASERYKIAVAHWAVQADYRSQYDYDSKTARHLRSKDCGLDPASIEQVEFDARDEGSGCDTCGSYTYVSAEFTASCRCGAVKNKPFEIDMKYKDLAEVLEEIMACEPYNITELAL